VIEALVAIAIFAALLLENSQSSNPLGRAIGQGIAKLIAVPFITCVLPGLGLALANRFVYGALAMVILSLTVTIVLWRGA
jgi:hypothetical protein